MHVEQSRRDQGWLYVSAVVGLSVLLTAWLASMIRWGESNRVIAAIWTLGFFCIVLNLSYNFVITLCSFFVKSKSVPEATLSEVPATAILYVVKNEEASLLKLMEETFAGNSAENIDLWLISNSDNAQHQEQERRMVSSLKKRFGEECVHYYVPANNPTGRKHLALQKWSADHQEYRYIMVCDADTVLHSGMLLKLIAKAEHPLNKDIMLFQSHMEMRRSVTRFARFIEPGQNLVERAFRRVNSHVFGRSPYYGHSALIRRKEFAKLAVPDYALSHDLWETAAMDLARTRAVLCEDATSEEMLPVNYLEDRARTRRWILGTLEATPLLFKRGLSLGTRFYLFLPLYMYYVQPVFLCWILLGLLAHNSISGSAIAVQPLIIGGAPGLDLEMGGMCLATLSVVWLYRLPFARSVPEFFALAREILLGTGVIVNNILYVSWYIVASPWSQRGWRPMKKEGVENISFRVCWNGMLPSTLIGGVLLAVGLCVAPAWCLLASPILVSFLLGSAAVYWTSKSALTTQAVIQLSP